MRYSNHFVPGLLLLVSGLLVSCNSGGEAETGQFACDGNIEQVQDLVSATIEKVPGFAGCAPDPENSGGYVVNVTSNDVDLEAVRGAIISHDDSAVVALQNANLHAVQVDVSGIDDWYQEAHNRLLLELPSEHKPEWQWFSAGLDEVHNQAHFLYGSEEARAWAQQFILGQIEAPPGVIVASLGDPGQDDPGQDDIGS